MNRNYKVIWNRSLGCFTAVAEYAKGRGKSSSGAVSSSASAAVSSGARLLRLSAICAGLAAAGLSIQANAASEYLGDNRDTTTIYANTGERLNVVGGAPIGKLSENNIGVIAVDTSAENQDTLTIKLAKDITGLDSVTVGPNVLNGAGLTGGETFVSSDGLNFVANGGASTVAVTRTGIKAGKLVIEGVADGVVDDNSQQAVNGSQLNATNTMITNLTNGTAGIVRQDTGTGAITVGAQTGGTSLNISGTDGTRTLSGLTNGDVSVGSTDAVNGRQLFTTNINVIENIVRSQGNMTALGGSFNAGAYVAPTYNVVSSPNNVATTPFTTVKGAVEQLSSAVQTPLTFAGDNGTPITRQLGDQLNIRGARTVANNVATSNISVTADGTDTLSVKLAENVNLGANGSVRMGAAGFRNVSTEVNGTGIVVEGGIRGFDRSSATLNNNDLTFTSSFFSQSGFGTATLNSNGLNIVGGPQFTRNSISASNNKITNVQNGTVATGSKDAVNGGQLNTTNDNVTTNADNIANLTNGTTGIVREDNGTGALTVGSNASATGDRSTAIGDGAVASTADAVAIGTGATAQGGQSVSVGTGNTADGNGAVAIGDPNVATGQGAVAVGKDNTATGDGAVAAGNTNTAIGNGSVALGANSQANANGAATDGSSIAIGRSAIASGTTSIALGDDARATAVDATAIGRGATAGRSSVALGRDASATTAGTVAIGTQSTAGQGATSVGTNAQATGQDSTALGRFAEATATGGVALGQGSVANVAGGATGFAPTAVSAIDQAAITATNSTNLGAVSVGTGAAGGNRQIVNVAAGTNDSDAVNVAQLSALSNTVAEQRVKYVSVNSTGGTNENNDGATGVDAIAIGKDASATAVDATAIGRSAEAGRSSVALGRDASATTAGTVAIGTQSTAGQGATSVGTNAQATGQDSTALGRFAKATTEGSVALGKSSQVNAINSVALGSNSIANAQSGDSFLTTVAANANNGTVSVGGNGVTRRITNVADGSALTDAVNVAQLTEQNRLTNVLGDNTATALGGNAVYDPDTGEIVDLAYVLDDGSNTGTNAPAYNNVGSALGNLDVRTTTNTSNIAALNTRVDGIDFPIRSSNSQPFTTSVTGPNALAVGSNANANGNSTTAVGENTNATGLRSSAIGTNALADKEDSSALGANARATDIGSTALGSNANASGLRSNAIGFSAVANKEDSSALGANARATGIGSTALGNSSDSSGLRSNALGANAFADEEDSSALGAYARATGIGSNALGSYAKASGLRSNAIGTNARAIAEDSNAIGTNSSATAIGGVALGQGSVANVAGGATGFAPTAVSADDQDAINATNSTNLGAVSVGTGAAGGNRQIVNVAAGTNDSDAVNVSQLKSVANVANQGFNITADNSILANNETEDNVQLGETVDFTNNDGNLVATVSDNGINYDLAEIINLGANGSVTTGNTVVNDAGVRVDDGNDNVTAVTTAGTNVTDGNGNTGNYGAATTVLTDNSGNINASAAIGNAILNNDGGNISGNISAAAGNIIFNDEGANISGAAGNLIVNDLGDTNTSTATSNIISDDGDNITTTSATGTSVTDGINTSNYGANGLVATDDNGNSTIVNQTGLSFTNTNGVTGPMITSTGINANDTLITKVSSGLEGGTLAAATGDTLTNAANIGDLQNATTDLTELGLNFVGDSGTPVDRNLGQTLSIKGGETDSTKLATGNNIGVTTNATNDGLLVQLAEDIDLGMDGSVRVGNTNVNNAGITILNGLGDTVTLDRNGLDNGGNRITNVADGAVADDAATFGQVEAVEAIATANNAKVSALGTSTAANFGGDSTYNDVTGVVSAPRYILDDGTDTGTTTDINNVGDALSNLNGRTTNNTTAINDLAAGRIGLVRQDSGTGTITIGATTGGTIINVAGTDGNRQISGVAAGTADSDAVNVSQLQAVSDALESSNEALSNAAVQYDRNPDDTINKGSITLGGTGGTTITNVKAGNVSAGSTDAINGSQLHNLGSDVASIIGGNATLDADGNLTASNIGGTGAGNINDAIAAVNQGNAQANENIQANTDRLDAGLSFSADNGDNISKSIGDGVIQLEGGDNITTTTTASGIKFDLSGNINVDSVTADSVTTGNTTLNSNGVTITNGPSMTSAGINAGGKTITGVADGIEATDAVNFGQLSALDSKLSNSVNELGYKINEVEDDANAGISAAMAMSSLPQAYIPGKSMIGGGVATYNGESAVAVGVSKVSDNGRWVFKVNGTADTQGNAGGAVGAGFHF